MFNIIILFKKKYNSLFKDFGKNKEIWSGHDVLFHSKLNLNKTINILEKLKPLKLITASLKVKT